MDPAVEVVQVATQVMVAMAVIIQAVLHLQQELAAAAVVAAVRLLAGTMEQVVAAVSVFTVKVQMEPQGYPVQTLVQEAAQDLVEQQVRQVNQMLLMG
jgi:hypothetical protein